MDDDTKANLSDRAVWVRVLYMLFFVIAYSIAEFLAAVVAIFQSVCALFTGGVNQTLLAFGRNLTVYVADILSFVTFNSDDLPFPFSDWPDESAEDSPWYEDQAMPTVVAEPSAGKEPSAEQEPSADKEPAPSAAEAADPDQDDKK